MSNVIKIKRGSGSDPSASDMVLGEPVLRTDTAELFFKKDDGSVAKVSGGGGGPDFKYLELRNAANNGAASYPANDFTLVSAGTTTAVSPAAAATLLVSVSGVIQKPNSGTSTSGITGFIVDGSRFKTATNLPAAPDFIIYQESGGIGEPSDNTVTSAKIVDGAIVNADINASAAIALTKLGTGNLPNTIAVLTANIAAGQLVTGHIAAGTGFQISNSNVSNSAAIAGSKISPSFTSDITISNANPAIFFTDTGDNPDYEVGNFDGVFAIQDNTNNVNRLVINTDGHIDIAGNVDFGAGIDVTGNITSTGTIVSDGNITIQNTYPSLFLFDTDHNDDFSIQNQNGVFAIRDETDSVNRFTIASDGTTDITNNLNVGAGIDVTGAITSTGNLTITNEEPKVLFVDSGHNPDYQLQNTNGIFKIKDATNGIDRFKVNSDGHVDIQSNLDVGNGIDVEDGDITLASGHTVDGRDVSADGSKLDGIESGATADQTNSEIKTAYEANSNTNAFTDALLSKLNGIAASATNVTNNNQLTNGAGYITSADGGNAATLDSIDSSQFVRSDASDTLTGATYTLSSTTNQKIILSGSSDPYIRFQEGTTNKAYIQWHSNGYISLVNSESSEELRIQSGSSGLKFVEGGNVRNVYHTGNLGVGDGFLSENNFTDALKSKLDGISSGATVGLPTSGGTLTGTLNARAIVPTANNTYDLGTSSSRWRNIYTNDLNLSNEGGANDVDGTYGSFTIQEGEEDLFLINRRNGKKYKFNLTEVI